MRNVDAILDHLGEIIADELLSETRAMTTPQSKMRSIFEIIETRDFSSQLIFFNALYEAEKALIEEMRTDKN